MTRVYRLAVEPPAGAEEPGWEPADWAAICDDYGWSSNYYGTRSQREWPGWSGSPLRRRLSFSRAATEQRAALLRRCGATVAIEASDPVTWPDTQNGKVAS